MIYDDAPLWGFGDVFHINKAVSESHSSDTAYYCKIGGARS